MLPVLPPLFILLPLILLPLVLLPFVRSLPVRRFLPTAARPVRSLPPPALRALLILCARTALLALLALRARTALHVLTAACGLSVA